MKRANGHRQSRTRRADINRERKRERERENRHSKIRLTERTD